MHLLKYKNLSRRDLLSMAAGATAVNTLWPLVPRLEAMEAEATASIKRYSYWLEPTNAGSKVLSGSLSAAGPLNFKNNWTVFNDPEIKQHILMLRGVSRPSADGGDGPHPNGVAGFSGWRGGGKGRYNSKCTSLDQVLSQKYAADSLIGDIRAGYRNDNGKDKAFDVSSSVVNGKAIARPQSPEAMYNEFFKDLNLGGGNSGGGQASDSTIRRRLSALDYVSKALARLNSRIAHEDKHKLDQHQTVVRSIETQLENIQNSSGNISSCEANQPDGGAVGTDKAYPIQSALMAAALGCNVTRVAGAYYGSAAQRITYSHLNSYSGGGAGYHKATHGKHSKGAYLGDVVRFRAQEVARYLKILKGYEEPDGSSLLDNTIFYMSTDVVEGHEHKSNVLAFLAGGTGHFKQQGNAVNVNARANDILTSIARYMGHNVDKFGDPSFGGGTLPNSVFSG